MKHLSVVLEIYHQYIHVHMHTYKFHTHKHTCTTAQVRWARRVHADQNWISAGPFHGTALTYLECSGGSFSSDLFQLSPLHCFLQAILQNIRPTEKPDLSTFAIKSYTASLLSTNGPREHGHIHTRHNHADVHIPQKKEKQQHMPNNKINA